MSSVAVVSPGTSTPAADRRPTKPSLRKMLLIVAIITAAIVCVAAVLCVKYWPFSERAVQEDLAEASDSSVIFHGYHPTYFPTPGCVLEGVEFRHGPNRFEIIAIDKLRIQGSYPGVLPQHVQRITAIGARVFIPPFGSGVQFHSQHSNLVVDELVANGTKVEFESADSPRKPLVF